MLHVSSLAVQAWIYLFAAPHSYSGEDVVEIHIPGNPLLARMLLQALVERGARHAEPGEFTARAYFNGRMDLAQAEGVAATIAAHSQRELHAARQLRSGELARRLRPILDLLADSLALVEVGLDFSEEDVSFLSHAELLDRVARASHALQQLLVDSARFEALSHEPVIVLVGRPNAGKSTLLNALAGEQRAVVSPHAGTTRDAIWSHARLQRGTVRMIDIAGIDDGAADEISLKMQQAARRTIESADVVVMVKDVTDPLPAPRIEVPVDLRVLAKVDLPRGEKSFSAVPEEEAQPAIPVSALTGENMDLLRDRLDSIAFGQAVAGTTLALNARHVEAITEACRSIERARAAVGNAGPEVVALELREALDCLGQILGSVTPDDVLGRIFGAFCIGK